MVTAPSCFPALPCKEAGRSPLLGTAEAKGRSHHRSCCSYCPATPCHETWDVQKMPFLPSSQWGDGVEPRQLRATSLHWLSWHLTKKRWRKHISSRGRPPRKLNLGGWNVLYVLGHVEDRKPLPACPESCKQHNYHSLRILNVTRCNLKGHWEPLMQTWTIKLPRTQGQL